MMTDNKTKSQAIIEGAERDAENYKRVDLSGLLRHAFMIEDGLNAYLHEKCGCAFAEYPSGSGRFGLMATRKGESGIVLGSDLDFLTMLDMAMQRRE